jgi:hypothetical protein
MDHIGIKRGGHRQRLWEDGLFERSHAMKTFARLEYRYVDMSFPRVQTLHVVVLRLICRVPIVHDADWCSGCQVHSLV